MLSDEENKFLTRVGPGTPMGNLMRQYWLPALLASELPEPDCRPVRVLLLGERLVAFRDSRGRAGLLANQCPHRGASLFFGRSEDGGLRCVYHGWKFDTDGRCREMPNEPVENNLRNEVRAIAYPCRERGGIIWAYMGPRSETPPLPLLEATLLPEHERATVAYSRACNWLQGLEGDIDTCHAGFLHFGGLRPEDAPAGSFKRLCIEVRSPGLDVADTEGGAMYATFRPEEPGWVDCRIIHFLFPFYALTEFGVLGADVMFGGWVPMDDEHLMFFGVKKVRDRSNGAGDGPGFETVANSTDWLGRFRLSANAGNDYFVDAEKQRQGDYTGITGIFTQDAAVTESMGPIINRAEEHLGASDAMIIRVRQRLIAAARALAERGLTPPGVDMPAAYAVKSGGVLLPTGVNWIEATKELRNGLADISTQKLEAGGPR